MITERMFYIHPLLFNIIIRITRRIYAGFYKINKDDNVAVALKPIAKGTTLNVAGIDVTTVEDIPQGHKFVIKAIKNGDPVIKYGFRIGFAQADIPVGAWVILIT